MTKGKKLVTELDKNVKPIWNGTRELQFSTLHVYYLHARQNILEPKAHI